MSATVKQIQELVQKLQAERRDHVDAIEEIDATFASLGLTASPATGKRRGRKPGQKNKTTKKASKRTRGKFKENADEFVLGLVKRKTLTTKQVNAAWKKTGRAGSADNALTKLVKENKIKRENIEGARGSKYSAA